MPMKGRGGSAEHAVIWEPLRQQVQMGLTAANLYLPLQSNFLGKGTLHPPGCKGVRRDHRPGSGPCPPRMLKGPCTALSELCSCEQLRTCSAPKTGRWWVREQDKAFA